MVLLIVFIWRISSRSYHQFFCINKQAVPDMWKFRKFRNRPYLYISVKLSFHVVPYLHYSFPCQPFYHPWFTQKIIYDCFFCNGGTMVLLSQVGAYSACFFRCFYFYSCTFLVGTIEFHLLCFLCCLECYGVVSQLFSVLPLIDIPYLS